EVTTDQSRLPAWPAVLGWLGLIAACLARLSPSRPARLVAWVLLANLLFHMPLHCVYGDADVSYSMHWSFGFMAGPLFLAIGRPAWTTGPVAALAGELGWVSGRTAVEQAAAHRAWPGPD